MNYNINKKIMKKAIGKISFLFVLITLLTSCQLGPNPKKAAGGEDDRNKAEVLEVLQTSSYTYLKVDKNELEQWIAVLKGDYEVGDIIYFDGGLEMNNFESPELGRTFEKVYFVQDISDKPMMMDMPADMPGGMPGGMTGTQPQKPVLNKLDILIEQPEGGVSIAELYANRKAYAGKTVKVKGQVTKVNEGIMGRNWVHIQDGTADGDNFDLTVTTDDGPMVGETIVFSGTFNINRDFGAGYTYEIILEDAIPVALH